MIQTVKEARDTLDDILSNLAFYFEDFNDYKESEFAINQIKVFLQQQDKEKQELKTELDKWKVEHDK